MAQNDVGNFVWFVAGAAVGAVEAGVAGAVIGAAAIESAFLSELKMVIVFSKYSCGPAFFIQFV